MLANVIDPNWVIALLAAGGAFLGVWRVATHWYAERRERQEEYDRLHCDIYGWPAQLDSYGTTVAPARPGALGRIETLEQRKPI